MRLILTSALLTVGACRHVPPAPIDPGANARQLESRSLRDPSVSDALSRYGLSAPANQAWSLDQLTVAAWALRPDIAVARSEIEAARANIRVQGKRPNPTISLGPERVISGAGGVSPWVLANAINFPIETAGKRGIRRQRAVASEQVAEWHLGEVLWMARAEVRNALFARDFAEQTVTLDDREASLRTDYLDWIDTRIKFGGAATQDRFVASQSLAEVESRRGLDNAALAAASANLATAVGIRPDAFSTASPRYPALDRIPEIGPADLAAARDAALANRVDIRRALAEYEVAEQDLRAAVAKQYPDVNLGPGYLFDQGDHKITLTVDFPIPLFDNGSAAIDAAIAARKVAAAKFNQVQAKALAEIDSGFARYQAMLKALASAHAAEADARKTQQTANELIKAGGADRGVLLTAELGLVTRQKNTLDARRAVIDALNALEDGIEKPIFPPSSLKPVGPDAGPSDESRS
jgi:outer membrane protein TolC